MTEQLPLEVVVGMKPSYTEWTCDCFCTAIERGAVP